MILEKIFEKALAAPTTVTLDPTDSQFDALPIAFKSGGSYADLFRIISKVIEYMLDAAGALAIIYLVYSGILYITAAGNPDNAKKGLQGIINASIGVAVIVLFQFILNTVTKMANDI